MAEELTKLTVVQHLTELRKRIIWVLIVNLTLAFACYYFAGYLFTLISDLGTGMQLIYIKPSELFMVYIKLAVITAVVLASPFTLYQIWAFIRTGLKSSEKAYVVFITVFGLFFFALGTFFSYKVVVPITLAFFLGLRVEEVAPMISVQEFVSFITSMLVSFGVVFEMPVVVALLAKIGILKEQMLKQRRGVIVVAIFVVAAVITPPDVVSQVLLAVPMLVLFQLSLFVCRVFEKMHAKALAVTETAEQFTA